MNHPLRKKILKQIPVTSRRFVGIIEELNAGIAVIAPLFGASHDLEKWDTIEDPKPVCWEDPAPNAKVNSIWSFYVDRAPRTDSDELEEKSLGAFVTGRNGARVPVPVHEALFETEIDRDIARGKRHYTGSDRADVRNNYGQDRFLEENFLDLEAIRRRYFVDGIELPFTPQNCVLICVRERFSTGPFELRRQETGRWLAPKVNEIPVLQPLRSSQYQNVTILGAKRYILKPSAAPPLQIATADYRDAELVLSDCVSYLSAISSEIPAEQVRVAHLSILREAESDNSAGLYRALRLTECLDALVAKEELRQTMERGLLEVPIVQRMIKERLAELRQELEATVLEQLSQVRDTIMSDRLAHEAKVSQLTSEEASLAQLIATRGSELRTLEQEEATISARIKIAHADLSQELDARIAEIAARVSGEVLSTTVQSVAPSRSTQLGSFTEGYGRNIPEPIYPLAHLDSCTPLEDGPEVISRLKKAASALCITHAGVYAAFAAIVCKRVPVVLGPTGDSCIAVLSQVLAGGRTLTRNVSQLNIEFGDLFGKFHANSMVFLPDADGLADLFVTLPSDLLHLVVFDGFNRCDEAVFSPILGRDGYLTPANLPIFHQAVIGANNPYSGLRRSSWPPSIFPILRHGANGIQSSQDVWLRTITASSVFTDTRGKDMPATTELTLNVLKEIEEQSIVQLPNARRIVDERLPAHLRKQCLELGIKISSVTDICSVLLACGAGDEDSFLIARDATIMAPIVSDGSSIEGIDPKSYSQFGRVLQG